MLASDIVESARKLEDERKYDPFHIEIIWEKENEKYDIIIEISIKPKEYTNGSYYN